MWGARQKRLLAQEKVEAALRREAKKLEEEAACRSRLGLIKEARGRGDAHGSTLGHAMEQLTLARTGVWKAAKGARVNMTLKDDIEISNSQAWNEDQIMRWWQQLTSRHCLAAGRRRSGWWRLVRPQSRRVRELVTEQGGNTGRQRQVKGSDAKAARPAPVRSNPWSGGARLTAAAPQDRRRKPARKGQKARATAPATAVNRTGQQRKEEDRDEKTPSSTSRTATGGQARRGKPARKAAVRLGPRSDREKKDEAAASR
jgi:hypothetical protein